MDLQDKLIKIKKKFTNKSSFLYTTYIWGYENINPNSKGDDLYTKRKATQEKILDGVFKNKDDFVSLLEEKGYTFTKTDDEMEDKLIDLGIMFDIKNYWHKKISMPRDEFNNECPWYDLYETKKKPNNKDAFEKIMKEFGSCLNDLNENIVSTKEIVCSGRRANCFCFGKINFKNTEIKQAHNLGITIIMLGPGSNEKNCGKYLPRDGKYDVIVTMREKRTYGELTERLIRQCDDLNMNYYVEIYDAKDGKYQELINHKPQFIHDTIDKFNMPVIYTDGDMYPTQYLDLFDQTHFDCMLYNARSGIADNFHSNLSMEKLCYMLDEMNISGGTMYWGASNASKNALK